jgi:hypothetical protein
MLHFVLTYLHSKCESDRTLIRRIRQVEGQTSGSIEQVTQANRLGVERMPVFSARPRFGVHGVCRSTGCEGHMKGQTPRTVAKDCVAGGHFVTW